VPLVLVALALVAYSVHLVMKAVGLLFRRLQRVYHRIME
jgi:hypothetical protein